MGGILLLSFFVTVVSCQDGVLSTESTVLTQQTVKPAPPQHEDTYIVFLPYSITKSRPADVLVDIAQSISPCGIRIELYNKQSFRVFAATRGQISHESPKLFSVQVPKRLKPRTYHLRIQGRCRNFRFQNDTGVRLERNLPKRILFAQTDKVLYKHGQTVHYRLFTLDEGLKLVNRSYNIAIKDWKTDVFEAKGLGNPSGLVQGNCTLSKEAEPDEWYINVLGENYRGPQFRVRKYDVPRIDFQVDLPPFLWADQEYFHINITAKYSIGGKYVVGHVLLVLSTGENENRRNIERRIHKFDGTDRFVVAIKDVPKREYIQEEFYGPGKFESPSFFGVDFKVTLTETLTGFIVTKDIRRAVYKYQERPQMPTISGGPPYKLNVKITRQDESKFIGKPANMSVLIQYSNSDESTTTATLPYSFTPEHGKSNPPAHTCITVAKVNATFSENNSAFIVLPWIPDHVKEFSALITYKGIEYGWTLEANKSPTRPLDVRVVKKTVKVGESQVIKITSDLYTDYFTSVITSSRILTSQREYMAHKSKYMNVTFDITEEMVPETTFIVYFRTKVGKLVIDTATFDVDYTWKNQVSIKLSSEDVKPSENFTLTVQTTPNSLVATYAWDNRLDQRFFPFHNELSRQIKPLIIGDVHGIYGAYRWVGTSQGALRKFSVLNNNRLAEYRTSSSCYQWPYTHVIFDPSRKPVFHTDFSDTWLFDIAVADSNGVVNITATAPANIPAWQIAALSFNDQTGFGRNEDPVQLNVLRNFFINVYIPATVILGEEILIEVIVVNNLKLNQTVNVELTESKGFVSLDIDPSGKVISLSGLRARAVEVLVDVPTSVVFPVRVVELGDIPVAVTARSGLANDEVTKILTVQSEGVPVEYNFIDLVNLTDTDPHEIILEISYPAGVVEGSQRIGVKILGDVLGNTLLNLGDLLRMPYGCGEQNMITVASPVFVHQYLESVGELTQHIRQKIMSLIRSGYTRQMVYRASFFEGVATYHAFKYFSYEKDIWLATFVAKSFAAAKKKELIHFGNKVLDSIIRSVFTAPLSPYEYANFPLAKSIFRRALEGRGGNANARAAYILMSIKMLDGSKETGEYREIITHLTERYVESYVKNSTDLYELAIGVYALTLAGNPEVDGVLRSLESRVTRRDGYVFWEVEEQPRYTWPVPTKQARAISIETTSYICMVYAIRKDMVKSKQCLEWLVSQQNDYGGFVSTRDTVVALEAFSLIAPLFYPKTQNGRFNVDAGGKTVSFNVNDGNRLEVQEAKFPGNANRLALSGTGTGLFLASISAKFNVNKEMVEPSFSLTATLTKDTPALMTLRVCAVYLRGNVSGMANIEISLPPGFSLMEKSEYILYDNKIPVNDVETTDGKIILYYRNITDEGVCVSITAIGNGNVNNVKPRAVQVYDYYNPVDLAFTFYKLTSAQGDFCDAPLCGLDKNWCYPTCKKRQQK